MRRLRHASRLLLRVLGVVLSGTLLGLLVFTGWLLATTAGARLLLDWVPRAGLANLHVDQVEGRLLGPLGLRGLHYRGDGVDVRLDRATLVWTPAALLSRTVRVAALDLGSLSVTLTPATHPSEPTPARIPQLPMSIDLARLRLAQLQLKLEGQDAPLLIEAVAGDGLHWSPDRFKATRVALHQAGYGSFEATLDAGLAPTRADVYGLLLRELPAKPPGKVPSKVPSAAATVAASGVVRLDPSQPSTLALHWKDLRWPLVGEPQATSAEGEFAVEGTVAEFTARGHLALGDTAQILADVRYSPRELAARLAWTGLQWPLTGAARIASRKGQLEASGRPDDFRYALDADLAAEGQNGVASAAGSGSRAQLVLDRLRVAVAKSAIEGQARLRWPTPQAPGLAADADLRIRNLDPGLVAPDWPGRINGTLKAQTTLDPQAPRTSFVLALHDSAMRHYPLTLDARGSSAGAVVTLDSLQLRSADTVLKAQGQVTPPFRLTAQLDSPDLAVLAPSLGGRAQATLALNGPLDAPHVVAEVSGKTLKFGPWSLARLQAKGDVDWVGAWTLNVQAERLGGPVVADHAQFDITGRDTDHDLRLALRTPQAEAALGAHGAFDHAGRQWRGEVQSGRLAPSDLAAWTLESPAALQVAAARTLLEPLCWRTAGSRACASVDHEGTRTRGSFRLEQLDFAYFALFLPPGWELRGSVDGTATAEVRDGQLTDLRADLATAPSEVLRDGETLLKAERGTLLVEETAGRATARLDLPLQGGSVAFNAELNGGGAITALSERPLAAHLDVRLDDLGFLRLATEEITEVAGLVQGRMNFSGTLGQPVAAGEIALSGAHLRLATPDIDITDIGLRLQGSADGALAISGAATSDKGTLLLDGSAQLAGSERSARLSLHGDNFRAADTTEARVWISPRMELSLQGERIDIRGEIDVPRADITPVSFEGGVAPSADQVIVASAEDTVARNPLQLTADVKLNLGERVNFKGFGLTTQLTGSVRAIEEPGRPGSGRGEVRLVDGSYKAYGQELQIETGRLLFNGGPLTEPAVEMRALRKPREDIEVGVLVRGTLDKPQFELFSTPAMPRERQLSWLVLGRSLDEGNAGADDRSMMASAALSLGLSGTDYIAQNLRDKVGVDEISIGAQPGDDAQQARFTVGKYLSPKLYVSYGIGIFQPGQFFRLLYELGRGFKVSTESGVHTGGDLLYSVERP